MVSKKVSSEGDKKVVVPRIRVKKGEKSKGEDKYIPPEDLNDRVRRRNEGYSIGNK